jgi:hypothetical protein
MRSELNQLPEPFGYVSDWFGAPDGLLRFSHTPFPELHNLTHSVCSVFSVHQVLDVQQQAYAVGKSARIAELEAEVDEQARLNGMGAERELALRAEVERLQRAITEFCQSHNWAAEVWKAEPSIKPLFDIARAIRAMKEHQ